jgi:F-type H+-transporting ATPase subunit delta
MTISNSKYANIARPYALAVFECARDKQDLPAWKAFLESAVSMVRHPDVSRLIQNPETLPEKLFGLFSEVLGSLLNDDKKNFLRLLAQNRRLVVLPEIASTFNQYYAALEKTSLVRIVTATTISKEFEEKLAKALTKRTERAVTLECEIDPSILGGAIIHIGDRVIDGSIRGKLTRLYQSLTG